MFLYVLVHAWSHPQLPIWSWSLIQTAQMNSPDQDHRLLHMILHGIDWDHELAKLISRLIRINWPQPNTSGQCYQGSWAKPPLSFTHSSANVCQLPKQHGSLKPKICSTLQWHHNDHDIVSNHQPHGCFLNRLFRRRSKKTSKLRVTGLCAGNSPATGEFPAQRTSNAEYVSIWWRHNDLPERNEMQFGWRHVRCKTGCFVC